jgi:hypothetical protein
MMEDPDTVDIIAPIAARGKLLLVMTEHHPWDGEPMRQQFLDKAKAYAGYILSNEFASEQPDFKPQDVVIKLACACEPEGHRRSQPARLFTAGSPSVPSRAPLAG